MMSCAMVGAYSSIALFPGSCAWAEPGNEANSSSVLTGSVSSASVVTPQWLIATNYSLVHDAMS